MSIKSNIIVNNCSLENQSALEIWIIKLITRWYYETLTTIYRHKSLGVKLRLPTNISYLLARCA